MLGPTTAPHYALLPMQVCLAISTALSVPAIAHHEPNLALQLQHQMPPASYASTTAYWTTKNCSIPHLTAPMLPSTLRSSSDTRASSILLIANVKEWQVKYNEMNGCRNMNEQPSVWIHLAHHWYGDCMRLWKAHSGDKGMCMLQANTS